MRSREVLYQGHGHFRGTCSSTLNMKLERSSETSMTARVRYAISLDLLLVELLQELIKPGKAASPHISYN
jgi:hypothetical protein